MQDKNKYSKSLEPSMKPLAEFITESKQQYEYKIKIAGDLPKESLTRIKDAFSKYEMTSMSDVKKTPVTSSPYDFPALENVEVHIFDVAFNYPAGEQSIKQIAELEGISPDNVRVFVKGFQEEQQPEPEEAPLLEKDLPESDKAAKDASKAYGESYLGMVKELETRIYEIEKGTDNG